MNCQAKDCNKANYSRSLCQAHYMAAYRLRKSGGLTLDPAIQMAVYESFTSKICVKCPSPVHGNSLCNTHYAQMLRARKKINA